ncbi:hypothetical protein ACIA5C_26405 [Actinoplanes sp. NPDC051343]|uniref:hypothetical protein n=1 Tax=Actinoplanes sp. NPDC051343 TaxID=3363906 RepID=UPI003787833C
MTQPDSPPRKRLRRWGLLWVAVVWGVVVAGLAAWGVWHEPATVPEQRTVGQALPAFRAAVGSLFAAAGGPGRALVLGDLQVRSGCRVTPVRHGVALTREVTVYVRAGEQRADIEAIAAALPAGYQAQVTAGRGGTQFALHADAGSFIAVDLDADVGDSALTIEVSSGCRPVGGGGVDQADPGAAPTPAALETVLTLLGAADAPKVTTQAVDCPRGGTAGTWSVGGVKAPGDWRKRLGAVASGSAVVRSDPTRWAYRAGGDSVVVVSDGTGLRVSVSTSC